MGLMQLRFVGWGEKKSSRASCWDADMQATKVAWGV